MYFAERSAIIRFWFAFFLHLSILFRIYVVREVDILTITFSFSHIYYAEFLLSNVENDNIALC